ncbi:hypothetical protein SC09_contig10orf00081 [Bacillus subtilis]|uniref:Uncharacterized protein n=1 Tax=Bacillus subtilis TaxID=1423 RepID=A0A0D1KM54_BACIU|nr:hypothetical protein SC09_contig10orf00081 [Bacillus subtilis]
MISGFTTNIPINIVPIKKMIDPIIARLKQQTAKPTIKPIRNSHLISPAKYSNIP